VFIYAASGKDGLHKIGRAINPVRRLGALQTGAIGRLSLVHSLGVPGDQGAAVESFAHWILRARHVQGEWFRISDKEAISAISEAFEAVGRGEKPGYRGVVGRKKQWAQDMQARFAEGTFERIAPLLVLGEDRTDFVRVAVEREIKRRERLARPTKPAGPEGDTSRGDGDPG
jgi:hypothetical protein